MSGTFQGATSTTAPAKALDKSGVRAIDEYLSLGEAEVYDRIQAAKRKLGDRAVILGHHYQRDDVICHADITGDSFKLARLASQRPEAQYIIFCGVHFMAESADILSADHQQVMAVGGQTSTKDEGLADQWLLLGHAPQ